jgi:hypothetical protein
MFSLMRPFRGARRAAPFALALTSGVAFAVAGCAPAGEGADYGGSRDDAQGARASSRGGGIAKRPATTKAWAWSSRR